MHRILEILALLAAGQDEATTASLTTELGELYATIGDGQHDAEIGEVEAIAYRTTKGDTRGVWEHEFGENGGRRPILAVDPRHDRLHLVGGDYRTTDRGIED